MKKLITAGMAASALLFAGCGTGGYGTVTGQADTITFNGNPGGSTPPPQPTSSTALFHVSAGVLPYPTDLYFAGSTDGTINIQPANALIPNQAAVNALDGFSTTAVIRERFGGPLNPASLTATSVIVMPVITDNQTKATVGVPMGATPLVLGKDFSAAPATDAEVGPTILEITPLHPLAPSTCISGGKSLLPNCTVGSGYLVILTDGITDAHGNAAVPDTDYANIKAALAAGGAKCPSITDPTLNGVCQLTGAQLQIAQALHLDPAHIVLTFSFTTESTADTLELLYQKTAATAQAVPPPIAVQPAVHPQLGQLTTKTFGGLGAANLYVGVLSIPYYLSKTAPLTGSWQAPPFPLDPTSTYVTRFNPLPVPTQTLQIPILMSVPLVTAMPAGGWPVLIFQHGITRSREDMIGVADSFASQGFVVVAIDLPLHGVTNATTDPLYASAANPVYKGLGLPTGQMSIERTFDLELITPGTIDPSGSHFINLTSVLTSRDNLREGPVDLMTFELALPNLTVPASAGVAAGKLGAAPVHYLGHSLGAIVGSTFLGVVPATDVSTGTLANPGGNISQLLIDSPSIGPEINAGLEAQGLTPGTTLYAQFFRDSQTVIDSGDPINYIALATAQHPIHLLQVVGSTPPPPAGCNPSKPANGCPDQVVPNSATQALILASSYGPAGLTQLSTAGPNLNPNGWRAFVNFTQGDHGSVIDDVVPAVTAEMQGEAISFAASNGAEILIQNTGVIQ